MFQDFTPSVTEYEVEVKACMDTEAEFLFLPLFDVDVAAIANLASSSDKQLVGSDGWGSGVLQECGATCVGSYISDVFDAEDPNAADFVQLFQTTYGLIPDGTAALNYDAGFLMEQALKECGEITCNNLAADRDCLRDAMAEIMFSGVAGDVTFDENGDPIDKCVTIRQISDELQYKFVKSVCPSGM